MVRVFEDTYPARAADLPSAAPHPHGSRVRAGHSARLTAAMQQAEALIAAFHDNRAQRSSFEAWVACQRDATEQLVLRLAALRRRSDIFLAQDAEDGPPVLTPDTEPRGASM
ncbi:hypothetical protein C8J30_101129 [Rhodobacter viridis]|uniref:Uncharacterized protein n=1 Tax=Rhodobacter viridis TaxID=1054202 RepID=A0A318U2P2_9RHOB|nr:hypothetical protein [Rhodobacter viridis]PYF12748.1 hypothetical protein C8J30_101129 [Rhodobacter viridis]